MAFVVDDIVLFGGLYLAYEGVLWGIGQLARWRKGKKTEDIRVTPELTEQDKELIEKCREVMKENFPEGIEARLKGLDSPDRNAIFQKLVMELNVVYGVNITNIAFLSAEEIGMGTYGYYERNGNSIRFNCDLIMSDDREVLHAMIDTIFHEMRHALQYRAVTDSSCNYGTEEQRRLWALNFANYIPAHVDFAFYQEQVVEADARQIAELVMNGF